MVVADCASLALRLQVHTAWLTDDTKVVVKVQHQEVARVMQQDVAHSVVLARLLAVLEPDFDFVSIIREATSEHEKELNCARCRPAADAPTLVCLLGCALLHSTRTDRPVCLATYWYGMTPLRQSALRLQIWWT